MERPLDIAFHNMESSAELEAEIRRHVDKLAKLYDRLTACRVSVEALHQQHRTGNLYEVHVIMSVPGRDLAVSHEPHRARERYAHPDVHATLREAFHAAERQLQDYKGKLRVEAGRTDD
jgi:ribosome-associated translation inhibitor RaiA